jgi:hypothetical protein
LSIDPVTETRKPAGPNASTPVQVQITGDTTPGIAGYAEQRLRKLFDVVRFPVLHARIRVIRHLDPARALPVVAQANLDVDGRFVRAQLSARTAREAVDLLHDRLRRRLQHLLERTEGNWEDRRARRSAADEHEWRHGDQPAQRLPYYPRQPEAREVVRHKTVTPALSGVDRAAADMEDMGYDFHLFTEAGTGQDSVLYRSGPTGYRLAQLAPQSDALLAPHTLLVTVSDTPAPALSVAEATERMAVWDEPFLFFQDRERGRGALLYHRYDGHYGLITPAAPSHGGSARS